MAAPVFPTAYDVPELLLSLLGTHWSDSYSGTEALLGYLEGRLEAVKQAFNDIQEVELGINRRLAPVFHLERIFPLVIKASEKNSTPSSILRYGEGAVYGNQPDTGILYTYGVPFGKTRFEFPISTDVASLPILFNRITLPSRSFICGVDFVVDREKGRIVFKDDPFEDDLLPQSIVYGEDGEEDREIELWGVSTLLDKNYLFSRWGSAVKIVGQSSRNYREFLNAYIDGLNDGGTAQNIRSAISAICDIPIAKASGEVVEDIAQDQRNLLIITDQQVYKFHIDDEATVSIGDRLKKGQPLTDSLRFYEFNRGIVPDDLVAISFGPELLRGEYRSGVTFSNQTVPVTVEADVDGKTKLSFALGGYPEDVDKFWSEVHARGVAEGIVLADAWDITYPATVNPIEFAVENLLRHNAFAVKIKPKYFGNANLGLATVRYLKRLIPPNTLMIVIVDIAVDFDSMAMLNTVESETGTGMEPGTIEQNILSGLSVESTAEYANGECE